MKRFVMALFFAVALLQPLRARAAFQTPDIRLDIGDAPGTSQSSVPQVCSTSDGHVYSAWIDYRNSTYGNIFFNRSTDFGHTWQANPTQLAYDLGAGHKGLNLACANDGRVNIVYADGDSSLYSICYEFSTDYGATWAFQFGGSMPYSELIDPTPRICMTESGDDYYVFENNELWEFSDPSKTDIYFIGRPGDGGIISHSFGQSKNPTISCTENGHVYVVWEDYSYDYSALGIRDLFFNYSSDYGQTWQPTDKQINEEIGEFDAYWPEMCNTDDGHVYIAWNDYRNSLRDVYFNKSSDYGATWSLTDTRLNVGDPPGETESGLGSLNCTANGDVYAVYIGFRDSTDNADIYFNRSADFGSTWQAFDTRVDLGDAPGQAHSVGPEMVSDGLGSIYIAFMDSRNGGWDILFNRSSDNGSTWQPESERVNTGSPPGSGDAWFPQILRDAGGHIFVSWWDDHVVSGTGDVYFNYWVPAQSGIPTLSDYMMLILVLALFCMLLIIERGRSLRVSSRVP